MKKNDTAPAADVPEHQHAALVFLSLLGIFTVLLVILQIWTYDPNPKPGPTYFRTVTGLLIRIDP